MNEDAGSDWKVQPDYFCVAFLDLLGQSARLDEVAHLPLPVQRDSRLDERLLHVYEPILNFHKWFFGAFDDVINPAATERPLQAGGLTGAKSEDSARRELKYQAFGDSVFLYVPTDFEKPTPSDARLIRGMLLALGCAMVGMMSEGEFPRGGIDIHVAADLGYGVYGPAARRAYQLESQVAHYPRIVVGRGLCSYLKSMSTAFPNLSEFSRKVIRPDTDDLAMLDYLGEAFHQEKLYDPADVKKAYERTKKLLGSFRHEDNTNLMTKYGRLAHYFESRASLWNSE